MANQANTWRSALAWPLVASSLVIGGCGDALLDGGDPGPPSLVLDVRVLGLDPTQANRPTTAVLVWTQLTAPSDPFEVQAVTLVTPSALSFEMRAFGGPSPAIVERMSSVPEEDAPTAALAFLGVVEGANPSTEGAPDRVQADLRGVSDDHFVLWVHRPEAAGPALSDIVVNPDALREGMNLVVGLCRPGRPSELLVVEPERVTVSAFEDLADGTCVDVFWADWR